MNKRQAIFILKEIKHRILKNTAMYIEDEGESDTEIAALDYAIEKLKQKPNDGLIELRWRCDDESKAI